MGRVARAPTEEGRPNMAPHSTHVVAWVLSMMMAASGIPMGYEYPVPEVPFIEGAQVSTTPAPDCVPGDLQDNPYYASLLEMGVPLCPSEYDDYDPDDIPEDQAAPEELPVYTEAPVDDYDDYDPNDIPEDQAKPDEIPSYTEAPAVEEYDEYDPNDIPADQAAPTGYNYPVPENPLQLPSRARKAKLVVDKEDEEEVVTIGLTHLDEDTYDPGNYDHNSPDYLEEVEEEERSGIEVIRQGGRGSSETGVSLTGPGHVISFHVPKEHLKMMEKQQMVMREDFGTERHVDPFSSLLGGE